MATKKIVGSLKAADLKGKRVFMRVDLKYLERPKGVTPKCSLRLSELLGDDVVMANDCIGEEVEKMVAALPDC